MTLEIYKSKDLTYALKNVTITFETFTYTAIKKTLANGN